MSRRSLIIGFAAWHLTAIGLGALPPKEQLSNFPARTSPSPLGRWGDAATAAFDDLAQVVIAVPRTLRVVTYPVAYVSNWYRDLTATGQSWAMFANPPQFDQYVRTRYYVQSTNGRQWIASELVMPAHREDRVRLLQSYRDSYQDKAIAIALQDFYRRRKPVLVDPATKSSQLPDDLAPVGRYFARRFARRKLEGTGQRIVRMEVWVGKADATLFGRPVDEEVLSRRLDVLQTYYEGPVEQRIRIPPYPPYHGGEQEADINWVLEYYEEP
jgi:hypothetical protein